MTETETQRILPLLRPARKRRGLKVIDIAEALTVTQPCITRWETGKVRRILSSLKEIVEVYGITESEIGSQGLSEDIFDIVNAVHELGLPKLNLEKFKNLISVRNITGKPMTTELAREVLKTQKETEKNSSVKN